MKRYSLIILAFALLLGFTQCKPEPENNPDDSRMIPVRFELPIDNGAKTDWGGFFQLTNDGTSYTSNIKWSNEDIAYLALPKTVITSGWSSTVVESEFIKLVSKFGSDMSMIYFEGEISMEQAQVFSNDNVLTVYHLGNREAIKYDNNKIKEITMDFSSQDGIKENLKDFHFASTKVKLARHDTDNDGTPDLITMDNFETNFKHEMAICYLDLQDVTKLTGTAVGNNSVRIYFDDVSSTYVSEWFIKEGTDGSITLTETPSKESFIVIPPSDDAGMTLECDKGTYSFSNRIIANTIYYGKGVGNNKIEPLPWTPNP